MLTGTQHKMAKIQSPMQGSIITKLNNKGFQ
ncbi:Uncharacterised protein [Ewingella americana]|uniref:Uncharacterized protein n=1 Tax=Ewingella americana TaxID=41202 RepID=A0A377NHY3_9GAMM|nr:Uncharacterised protein [Ewingella americana]